MIDKYDMNDLIDAALENAFDAAASGGELAKNRARMSEQNLRAAIDELFSENARLTNELGRCIGELPA